MNRSVSYDTAIGSLESFEKMRKIYGIKGMFLPGRSIVVWLLAACATTVVALSAEEGVKAPAGSHAGMQIQFNRDIRPILSDNCFRCHGPDKSNRKAKLRLDQREAALESEAFAPGKPDESELIRRVFSADPEEMMPPPDSHKTLTQRQKELLKQWIAGGAEYQAHWAYIRPTRPAVPAVRRKEWVRSPIDAFILAELEKHSVEPSAQADRSTLLRRLSLDLVGLPPTPSSDGAASIDLRTEIERLLASPHFGERMAVGWLDVVRFADTVGYHGDQNQNIFPYRDYVINAFNQNKPFDQFTIEQIAGDLLPNASPEQRVATGFNRLNMVTREGGAQPKEYLAKYAADRVRTVSTAWMGSTMACAECHDHKFDPFSTKDFYSLAAFFGDVKQWGVYNDYTYTPNPDLKGWSNEHPFPPELEVESPYLQERQKRVRGRIREQMDALALTCGDDGKLKAWRAAMEEFLLDHPTGWLTPRPFAYLAKATNTVRNTNIILKAENVIVYGSKASGTNLVQFEPGAGKWASLRLELVPDRRHGGRILRDKATDALVQVSARLKPANGGKERRLSFAFAEADRKETTYDNGAPALGVMGGWKISSDHIRSRQTAVYCFSEPLSTDEGDLLTLTLRPDTLGAIRISLSPFAMADPLAVTATGFFTKAHPAELYLMSAAFDTNLVAQRRQLHRDLLECGDGKAFTLVTEAWKPATTRVLPRGNWQDESGEIVEPAAPHFLTQISVASRQPTRLDLAKWLVSPENPLTARTIVNRLWKQFFGVGLCGTVDDLGLQGDVPSHPDLLDWLAVEFQESGWNVKHMIRLIVSSASYQQQAQLRPELRDIDPQNRLLASQNPRRLEAEFVRDNALKISGLLNDDLGGPSARPYQPAGYYANLQFPDRDYVPHRDDRQYRRGIYVHWQRTFLHPMLANFDAPSREECTANRVVSNTPQQALTLLNDPSFMEAAQAFARRLLEAGDSEEARIHAAFQAALGRDAKAKELESLKRFLGEQRANKATDFQAWTSLCRVVLNLHETITIY